MLEPPKSESSRSHSRSLVGSTAALSLHSSVESALGPPTTAGVQSVSGNHGSGTRKRVEEARVANKKTRVGNLGGHHVRPGRVGWLAIPVAMTIPFPTLPEPYTNKLPQIHVSMLA